MAQHAKLFLHKNQPPRPFTYLGFVSLTNLFLFSGLTAIAQEGADYSKVAQDILTLEPAKPIERGLAGGQVHFYTVKLASGQYLRAIVDQRGIDVVVTLFGPDDKKLFEMDSPNGTQGPEPVSIVAESSGNYRIEVRSLEEKVVPGLYEIRIEALRLAVPLDRSRVAAERLSAYATLLTIYNEMDSVRIAVQKYNETLPLWRSLQDTINWAQTLNMIGNLYNLLGDKREAIEYYEQSLPLWKALHNISGEATALGNIAAVSNRLGEKTIALEYFQKALQLWETTNDLNWRASTLNNIGSIKADLGNNREAMEYYTRALTMARTIGNRTEEAHALNDLAFVFYTLGENQRALVLYSQALVVDSLRGDKIDEAGTKNNIGMIYDNMGEYQKASQYYQQALKLWRMLQHRFGEASTLNNIGSTYLSLGDPQSAFVYFQQALPIFHELGSKAEEASTLSNMARVYQLQGELNEALIYLERALALKRIVQDRNGEANTLNSIGKIHLELDESEKAKEYHTQALTLWREVGNKHGEAKALINLGAVYCRLNNHQQEVECYKQAQPLVVSVQDREGEATTLLGFAHFERDRGNLIEAQTNIEAAVKIIEALRMNVVSQELRSSFFATKQRYYDFYIELMMQLHQLHPFDGFDAKALHVSESAKARSFLDILIEANIDVYKGVDSLLIERERTLQQLLNAKSERLTRLLNNTQAEEKTVTLKKDIETLLTQYQEIQAQIRATNPHYAALTQPQPLGVKEIQQQLLDDGTILLEYALGSKRSFLWAVTPTTIHSYILPKHAEIDSFARQTYSLLTARNQELPDETEEQKSSRLVTADKELSERAAILSHILLGPVSDLLGNKRLLIVSDGALQYIPFGALPAPSTKVKTNGETSIPLIVEHEIVSIPSASVLAVLRHELSERLPAKKMVAALADPVFTSDDPRVRRGIISAQKMADSTLLAHEPSLESALVRSVRSIGMAESREGLQRLIYSRREVEGIMNLVTIGQGKKAFDFEANRAIATSAGLSTYRMVHFATHGILNNEYPELSGIVLSLVDENGKEQDGFIRLHEIYNLNLPAEIVVLSACQTALGKEVKGEGLIGLTRGFMYAGAARVVASLWNVKDDATAELMKWFYKKMLGEEKLRPAAALRAAQLELWKTKRWKSHYFWAGFVLQGEWR